MVNVKQLLGKLMLFDAMFLKFLTIVINAGIHVGCCGCHARFEGTAAQRNVKALFIHSITLYDSIWYEIHKVHYHNMIYVIFMS